MKHHATKLLQIIMCASVHQVVGKPACMIISYSFLYQQMINYVYKIIIIVNNNNIDQYVNEAMLNLAMQDHKTIMYINNHKLRHYHLSIRSPHLHDCAYMQIHCSLYALANRKL